MGYRAPKGANDVLPTESPKWRFVEETFRHVSGLYGYLEIRTPIFEQTDLFTRGLGESTDIVSKEMYTLTTRGGDSLTLKPEGTAPVVRAYIEHHLGAPGVITKLSYVTPIFRYERPQAGRYRQAHQVGIEAIGSEDPLADAEVIAFTMDFYARLGLRDTELRLNSVGTSLSRPAYRSALLAYARPYFSDFDCEYVERLEKNPLRLLDSKDPEIRRVMEEAPDILDFLDPESRAHFDTLCEYLTTLGIPFVRDRFLVRGLDYYTRTAFEVVSGQLGAQNSLCGGGRYDGLIEECGGEPTPGVGVAMGIERALLVLESQGVATPAATRPVAFVVILGNVHATAMRLVADLRAAGVPAEMDLTVRSLKAQMRQANKSGARFAVILGEDELSRGVVAIKDLETNEQTDTPLEQVVTRLQS